MHKTVVLIIAASVLALASCSTTQHASNSVSASASNGGDAIVDTPAAETLLDHLVGKWVLTGTIDGKETTHDIDAEWILNREYVRLHEVSRDRGTNGQPAYEAIVLISWDHRPREYSCLWLDSTGGGGLTAQGIAHGKPTGNTIPFVFNLAGGIRFYNTFIYLASSGTWRWDLDGEEGGKLQPFARVKLTKT